MTTCVLAIIITPLVAEIVRPEPAQSLERLAAQWASYIAFLASFCYAGMIRLNHRAVFARVRCCDRGLHLANLLLTSALIPFPTAILSAAVQSGTQFDAEVAVTLDAGHDRRHVPVMARRVSRSEHSPVSGRGRR